MAMTANEEALLHLATIKKLSNRCLEVSCFDPEDMIVIYSCAERAEVALRKEVALARVEAWRAKDLDRSVLIQSVREDVDGKTAWSCRLIGYRDDVQVDVEACGAVAASEEISEMMPDISYRPGRPALAGRAVYLALAGDNGRPPPLSVLIIAALDRMVKEGVE